MQYKFIKLVFYKAFRDANVWDTAFSYPIIPDDSRNNISESEIFKKGGIQKILNFQIFDFSSYFKLSYTSFNLIYHGT